MRFPRPICSGSLSGLAFPPRLLRRAHLLAQPRRLAHRASAAQRRHARLGQSRHFRLRDFKQHIIHTLKGRRLYRSALAGFQHLSGRRYHGGAADIGYDQDVDRRPRAKRISPPPTYIRSEPEAPFWLSVGFFETHREFPTEHDVNPDYVLPPALFPDTPGTRQDMANYIAMARILDDKIGHVLRALDETGLRENTLVIYTTDHGLAFPDMKCNLTDHGIGVALIMDGPAPFERRARHRRHGQPYRYFPHPLRLARH